jgi:hypothetical protein
MVDVKGRENAVPSLVPEAAMLQKDSPYTIPTVTNSYIWNLSKYNADIVIDD